MTTILAVGFRFNTGRQRPDCTMEHLWPAGSVRDAYFPDRRQLITCGAAAGLAAGFNAPLQGVLFVVEELLHISS